MCLTKEPYLPYCTVLFLVTDNQMMFKLKLNYRNKKNPPIPALFISTTIALSLISLSIFEQMSFPTSGSKTTLSLVISFPETKITCGQVIEARLSGVLRFSWSVVMGSVGGTDPKPGRSLTWVFFSSKAGLCSDDSKSSWKK